MELVLIKSETFYEDMTLSLLFCSFISMSFPTKYECPMTDWVGGYLAEWKLFFRAGLL